MPLCSMIWCPDGTFGTTLDWGTPPMLRAVVAVLAEVRTSGTTLDWSGTGGTSPASLAELTRVGRSGEEPHISKSNEPFIQVFNCECLPEHWVGLIHICGDFADGDDDFCGTFL